MKVLLCVQYVNTELQRCQQAEEGGPFEMEVVVQTTATYGERFRALIKHRSEASQPPAQAFAAALTSAYPTCEGKSLAVCFRVKQSMQVIASRLLPVSVSIRLLDLDAGSKRMVQTKAPTQWTMSLST